MTDKEKLILQMYSAYQRKKTIIIVSVVVFFVLALLCGVFMVLSSPQFALANDTVNVEYGDVYVPNIADFVEVNENINTDNTSIEGEIPLIENKKYADVGKYELQIVHKSPIYIHTKKIFEIPKTKTVTVNVVDTTNPVFSDKCPAELHFMALKDDEAKPNLAEYFTADDLSGVCNISIINDSVDYKTAGKYVVEVTATDKYNNTSSMSCAIIISQLELIVKNENINIDEGNTSKIEVSTNSNEKITYKSENSSVCTVDENGNIKAIKSGECRIIVNCGGLVAVCNVIVNAIPVQTEKPTTTTQPQQSNSAKNNTSNNSSKKDNYPEKDFLFTEGYTMDNVTDAAYSYLKASGKAGSCIPLKNDEGIYIGMRVVFN